ncbi:GTPase [Neobacillus drentensis]|uniref:GTPase n=1 Tax=Neobacillus drentensis TaxID=220684 RepID=UPI0030009B43
MGFEQNIENEFETQKKNIQKPNLMVVGGTGVGKSSLINLVFGKDLATVGSGKPITRGLNRYEQPHIPLVIFDTEGYEITDGQVDASNFYQVVIPEIKRMQIEPLSKQVHLVWYCISISNHRITSFDLENIKLLSQELRLKCAVVFTQCDNDPIDADGKGKGAEAFREALKEHGLKLPTFETCSTDRELQLDLEELLEWSSESLSNEDLRQSFIGAQRHSIELKRKKAYRVVTTFSATSAATAGANPFPLSDSALLVPQQIAMAVTLSKTFGFDSLGDQISTLLKSQLVSIIGKQLAASLTKLIPVFGQVVNAAVAATLTGGMGIALIEIYSNAYRTYLDTGKSPDWASLFSNFDEAFRAATSAWKEKQA